MQSGLLRHEGKSTVFPFPLMIKSAFSTKYSGICAKKSESKIIVSYGKLRGTNYNRNLREYKNFNFDLLTLQLSEVLCLVEVRKKIEPIFKDRKFHVLAFIFRPYVLYFMVCVQQ